MSLDYERLVVMDADGIPMTDLDHLFLLPLPDNVYLAAPQAYWFEDAGGNIWDRFN